MYWAVPQQCPRPCPPTDSVRRGYKRPRGGQDREVKLHKQRKTNVRAMAKTCFPHLISALKPKYRLLECLLLWHECTCATVGSETPLVTNKCSGCCSYVFCLAWTKRVAVALPLPDHSPNIAGVPGTFGLPWTEETAD